MKYRFEWISSGTGETGHGEWVDDKQMVETWVMWKNKQNYQFGWGILHHIANDSNCEHKTAIEIADGVFRCDYGCNRIIEVEK